MDLALTQFSMRRPAYWTDQRTALDWLGAIHAASQATTEQFTEDEREAYGVRLQKVIDRCACGPKKISGRGHVLKDVGNTNFGELGLYDVTLHPHGRGTAVRSALYADAVNTYFKEEYEYEAHAPSDILHVTCTGYVSPSGAQRLVQERGWGHSTRVTHAYHMGCYAAFPALRIAAGCLSTPPQLAATLAPAKEAFVGTERRVDIVHTELCSLHLDPQNHSIEQLVVQSLFADGFIRYAMRESSTEPGLRVLALDEQILPDSCDSMSWVVSDWGMQMTLARDVPERIAGALHEFVKGLFEKAGLDFSSELDRAVFAVHPGGPRIIDHVCETLHLRDTQVQTSRDVLFDHGNMSSATLPHIWMRLVSDEAVAVGTTIVSLAFGPGLTVCGGIFRKQ